MTQPRFYIHIVQNDSKKAFYKNFFVYFLTIIDFFL